MIFFWTNYIHLASSFHYEFELFHRTSSSRSLSSSQSTWPGEVRASLARTISLLAQDAVLEATMATLKMVASLPHPHLQDWLIQTTNVVVVLPEVSVSLSIHLILYSLFPRRTGCSRRREAAQEAQQMGRCGGKQGRRLDGPSNYDHGKYDYRAA